MKKTIIAATLIASALGMFAGRSAIACPPWPMPIDVPSEPAVPRVQGSSLTAAMLKPVRLTQLDGSGSRHWRAVYEIVNRADGAPALGPVVMEWACDAADSPGAVRCTAAASEALPGFTPDGRPRNLFIERDMRHATSSTLDGVPIWGARLDDTRIISAPVYPRGFADGMPEGALPFVPRA